MLVGFGGADFFAAVDKQDSGHVDGREILAVGHHITAGDAFGRDTVIKVGYRFFVCADRCFGTVSRFFRGERLRCLTRQRFFPTGFGFAEGNPFAVMGDAVIAADTAGIVQIGLNLFRIAPQILDVGGRVIDFVMLEVGFIAFTIRGEIGSAAIAVKMVWVDGLIRFSGLRLTATGIFDAVVGGFRCFIGNHRCGFGLVVHFGFLYGRCRRCGGWRRSNFSGRDSGAGQPGFFGYDLRPILFGHRCRSSGGRRRHRSRFNRRRSDFRTGCRFRAVKGCFHFFTHGIDTGQPVQIVKVARQLRAALIIHTVFHLILLNLFHGEFRLNHLGAPFKIGGGLQGFFHARLRRVVVDRKRNRHVVRQVFGQAFGYRHHVARVKCHNHRLAYRLMNTCGGGITFGYHDTLIGFAGITDHGKTAVYLAAG